jgi:hypothetical protein
MEKYEAPAVLLIVFNRLQDTKKVFEKIRQAKPKQLFISCDGPRKNVSEDYDKVKEVRNFLIESIDWDCELQTLFHEENFGCKYAPHNAITWFFEHVDAGVILEDDCVPDESFFRFSDELLTKYEGDFRVFGISGTNFNGAISNLNDSYYFSDFFMTWGWATWKNRWQIHLELLNSDFSNFVNNPRLVNQIKSVTAVRKWAKFAEISSNDELDAWDYPWSFNCFLNGGRIIVPKVNLVTNVGFGDDATHTVDKNKSIRNHAMNFPLIHPATFLVDKELDDKFFKEVFGWLSLKEKILSVNHIISFIKKRIMK